jgi:CotS family spore coat protein
MSGAPQANAGGVLMNDLLHLIQREYALSVDRRQPFRSVWKLHTSKGIYLLKQMHCTEDQLLRIDFWITQLINAGFSWTIPFLSTRDGLPFMEFKQQLYIISPWQPGIAPVLTNLNHLKKIAGLWSTMHRVSQVLLPPDEQISLNHLEELRGKTVFLETLLQSLRAQPSLNRIDRSILKWGEYFSRQASFSLAQLEAGRYEEWTRATTAKGFCHNDPAPGNIIIQNQDWYIIDFELSGPGLFLTELLTLVQRALKANHWKAEIIEPILDAYGHQRPASPEELGYLPALLCFPRAFLRLCSQRFSEKLPWTEKHFQSRLWEITTEEPLRLQLLRSWFPELVAKTPARVGQRTTPSIFSGGCS